MNLPGCNLAICVRILAAALLLAMPFPAQAVLGDSAASVLTDQTRMKGTLRSTDNGTYVMHEITVPMQTTVREFVSPAGIVFGVAWEGQFTPDLQQLLGPYYQQAKQACRVPAAAACKARADCHQHARLSVPANRPSREVFMG